MNTKAKGRTKYNLMNDNFFESMRNCFDFLSSTTTTTNHNNNNDNKQPPRVAVLYSSPIGDGTHFSAGLDLKETASQFLSDTSLIDQAKLAATAFLFRSAAPPAMSGPAFPAMKQQQLRQHIKNWQDSVSAIARCRVPVIAVLTNCTLGGAVDVASACDMRVASETMKMAIQETKVGVVADVGTLQRLPGVVGQGVAREWAFTGRVVRHREALAAKFVNHVLPDDRAALARALAIAAEIATACSPLAVQGTKEVLNQASERAVEASLEFVRTYNSAFLLNDDVIAASLAFMQKSKEPPEFSCHVVK